MKNKTIFIGGFCNSADETFINEVYGYFPVFSSDPLQKSIVKGLSEHLNQIIDVYNLIFYPPIFKIFRSKKSVYELSYCHVINVPFLYCKIFQHFSKYRNLYKYLKNISKDVKNVIVYSAYYPFLMALDKIKKKRPDLNICLIVPDLPQFIGLTKKDNLYKRLSKYIRTKLFHKYNRCIDSYVMLTKHMNNLINDGNKPSVVIEGIIPNNYVIDSFKENNRNFKTILYSGTLHLKYGIDIYLKAINLVTFQDVKFIFYGSGDGLQDIIEASKKDNRIIYGGTIKREYLHIEQQKSTVLINPRQNINEFTKYSFPSKILEYMMSGRPVIAYKLDGIPNEYDQYLIYPKDNSAESLADIIMCTLMQSDEYLSNIGMKSRDFVLKNKNYLIQTQKILELLK